MPRQHCTGGCECGAGAYEVDADLNRTVTGNRSRCRPLGSVQTFVTAADFRLTAERPVMECLFDRQAVHPCPARPAGSNPVRATEVPTAVAWSR